LLSFGFSSTSSSLKSAALSASLGSEDNGTAAGIPLSAVGTVVVVEEAVLALG
jgi:hypothetical protein